MRRLAGQEQHEATEKHKNTISDVNFSYPLNNTFNLGTPFLVQYDNTTSVKALGSASLDNFIITFAGRGILNGTMKYNDNGTGRIWNWRSIDKNPFVRLNGIISCEI